MDLSRPWISESSSKHLLSGHLRYRLFSATSKTRLLRTTQAESYLLNIVIHSSVAPLSSSGPQLFLGCLEYLFGQYPPWSLLVKMGQPSALQKRISHVTKSTPKQPNQNLRNRSGKLFLSFVNKVPKWFLRSSRFGKCCSRARHSLQFHRLYFS